MTLDLIHLAEHASVFAAGAFVSGVWQGIVLALSAWLALRLLPRATAAVRFLVWSAVFAALAVLPLLHATAPKAAGAVAQHATLAHVDIRWSFVIAAIWLSLSTIRLIKLFISAVQLRRIWRRATPVTSGILAERLIHADMRGAELCISADVDSPSVIGFFSPRVLIPEDLFAELTAEELEQIVLHEIGHLRRADDWINLAQKFGLVLFPLNPALMWVERRLCLERELACDDDVLRLTKAPKAYATCLATIAERRLDRRLAALTLGAWEKRSELSRRVYSILRRAERMSPMQSRAALAALILALTGGSAELARSPQLVAFTRSVSPVSAAASAASAPGYQPVVFHESTAAAHPILLKATMRPEPSQEMKPAVQKQTPSKHRAAELQPAGAVQHPAKKARSDMQQWVVLTSWDGSGSTRMVMAVSQQNLAPSYAAVPTAGGWLVFQL